VIQNAIEPKVKLVEDGVTDPMRIAFGVSALSAIGDVLLVTAIDLYSPRYSPFKIQFAQEVSYLTRYAIRGSLDGDTPTWGVGVRIRGVGFDYAYRSQDIDQNHRVSLSFRFGRSISETRAAARAALEQEVNGAIDSRVKEFERTRVESAIVEGDRLFAEKRYSEALDRYSVAIVWDPGNQHAKQYSEKAQYMRAMQNGNEFYQRGDFVGALLHFRSALERAPGDSTAMAMAHRCNAEISRLKQAKALASRLLKQAIESYDGRRFSDALTGFEDVLRVDPANEFARELRDRCAANIDRIVQEHRRKARRAAESGDYSEAVRELESIAAYVKLDRDTEREIGELLEAQRRAENRAQTRISAIAQQQPASKSAPNESSIKKLEQRYSEAMESFKAGDFDAAIKGFQDVWAVDPAFHAVSEFLTKAFLLKGMRLYGQERYDEAATSWRLALNIDPENEKIKRYLEKIGEELQRARGDKRG
jgi:tetratricopeptide (TPR) repeat protein